MVIRQDTSNIDTPLDYVDDSEPERKRIKLQVAETKRRRKRQKHVQHQFTDSDVAHDSPALSHISTYNRSADGETISLKNCLRHSFHIIQDLTYSLQMGWTGILRKSLWKIRRASSLTLQVSFAQTLVSLYFIEDIYAR